MSQPKSLSLIRLASTASMTALALSLIANPAPAQAAGACGVPAQDVVDCGSEDAPFPNGIDYSVVGDLTVNIGDDLLVEPDPGHAGIILSSDGGSIVVNGGGADVTARDSSGIVGFATGDLTVAIDDVSTHGLVARGIDTFTFAGDTVIDADSVTTSGAYAFGIIAQSGVGDISVAARSIDTNGYAADGITASTAGDISITAEDIRGAGDYVWGVNVSAGGYVDGQTLYGNASVEVGSIEISGDHAVGVVGVSYGDTTVKVDRISIDGDYGTGVGVIAMGDHRGGRRRHLHRPIHWRDPRIDLRRGQRHCRHADGRIWRRRGRLRAGGRDRGRRQHRHQRQLQQWHPGGEPLRRRPCRSRRGQHRRNLTQTWR